MTFRVSTALSVVFLLSYWIAGAQAADLRFLPAPEPQTIEDKKKVHASPAVVTGDGSRHPIGFHRLLTVGDAPGGRKFGQMIDRNGNPVAPAEGDALSEPHPDYTSLIQAGSKLFALTHIENAPGGIYISELEQAGDGRLTPVSTRPVDFTELGGLWIPCAGVVTAWGTHLGSEEFPPDARKFEIMAGGAKDHFEKDFARGMLRYFGVSFEQATTDDLKKYLQPYKYGYLTEVHVNADGGTRAEKHYAAGRFSHEVGLVMPDRRTVYMSDDDTNGGFFMFVADKPADLSSGTLYAARWEPDANATGKIDWISLGHSDAATIKKAIDAGVGIADLLDVKPLPDSGKCEAGFTSINHFIYGLGKVGECVRAKPGKELIASRLETRRVAALRGATIEFRKSEGLAYDDKARTLYMAISEINRGMLEANKSDRGGRDHIRLARNNCGAVFALDVAQDAKFGSDYVARSMRPALRGVPSSSRDPLNPCRTDTIANPDNIAFGAGLLFIAEDSKGHEIDRVWAWTPGEDKPVLVLTMPHGAEATSVYHHGDIGGHGYLMIVAQHPYKSLPKATRYLRKRARPEEKRSIVGYLGPLPPVKEQP